jgi:N-acetylmuramoyl-L-alanine amidase
MSPNGTAEKAITAALAARLERALAESGTLSAVQTRKEDREMSTGDRVTAASSQSAGLLLSLHTGAALSPQAPLIQIYHSPIPVEGGDLAACATRAKAVAEAMAKALAAGDDPPAVAVRTVPLRLQTAAKMPCVLVELGSLNQAEGESMLVAEERRGVFVDQLAKALAAAVADVNAQR